MKNSAAPLPLKHFTAQAVPLYLSEIAPSQARGALNILFQMATTLGILGVSSWTTHCTPLALGLAPVPGPCGGPCAGAPPGELAAPRDPQQLAGEGAPLSREGTCCSGLGERTSISV